MTDGATIERLRGVRIETGADRPFLLNDPDRVFLVDRGYLDVFAVELDGEEPVGRRRFVARVPPGEMAFSVEPVEDPDRRRFGLLAVPSLDTVVIDGARDGVASDSFDLTATVWIDEWVSRCSAFLVRGRPPPAGATLLEALPDVSHGADSALSAQHRDVIWVSAGAPMGFNGRRDFVIEPGAPPLPLTEQTWVELAEDAEVSSMYTPTALVTDRLWPAFFRFLRVVLEHAIRFESDDAAEIETRRRRALNARRASTSAAVRDLTEILNEPSGNGYAEAADGTPTPLAAAAGMVADSMGASFDIPGGPGSDRGYDGIEDALRLLERMALRAGVGTRRVSLEAGWWKRDGNSFVGFTRSGERPLAVLSNGRGGYRVIDPGQGTECAADGNTAEDVAPKGLSVYAPLPDGEITAGKLLRFAFWRRGGDVGSMFAMGTLAGVAALLVPILTGHVLAEAIPRADVSSWIAALGALALVAFGNLVFGIVQGIALLRFGGRTEERLQAAVWYRLLSLPLPFFRRFTVGDLANRAESVTRIRVVAFEGALQVALGSVFSIFSLLLLFWYSWLLALYVCGALAVLTAAVCFFSHRQMGHCRTNFESWGAMCGFTFQVVHGIAKLRVANAVSYALARWTRHFTTQKRAHLAAQRWGAGQRAVTRMFPPLTLIAIFAYVYEANRPGGGLPVLDLGAFLAFNAAFGQLAAAVANLSVVVTNLVCIVPPLLDRLKPVLRETPEHEGGAIDPGDLTGDIEFANVAFRYEPDAPNAVDGVSFRIAQGEYVAFVGTSGCGKSTLYRLVLGFDRPDSGTVLLDGHDLLGLDVHAVRSQMGVVLQDGMLTAGSIYEIISGLTPLNAEDAWAAARAAALEDEIRAMPMGMHTMVSDGGGGFSTGQKQRLRIARALASKPRILLFDEATSALDNVSQAVVQNSIRNLGVTRIVIAHRLSTIRDVDRIYVLDAGRIVETGSYEALMSKGGVFANLARRQLVQG